MTKDERLALAVQMAAASIMGRQIDSAALVSPLAYRIKVAYNAVYQAEMQLGEDGGPFKVE